MGAFQDHRPCCNNAITAYNSIVHDNGAHSNEHVIGNGTAVNDGIVPYGYIVTNNGLGFLVGAVDDGSILNIHLIPHSDAIDVSPYDSVEPNATVDAHDHVPNDGGVRRYETIFTPLGLDPIHW
jgi:hypothetical protein